LKKWQQFWHSGRLATALQVTNTPFGRGKRNGMEKKKEYFKNILFFLLFGSLSRREWKGMERPFPCLRV
jgi:hypothetical protein